MSDERTGSPARGRSTSGRYLLALGALVLAGFVGLVATNRVFAPEMYTRYGVREIAEAFAAGENYAVFDLNINIRELRDEHLARMKKTPDIMVLGASHWQEAHRWLLPKSNFYNAHVHRDYYEDMLGMVEMLVRHDKLPKRLIIAIRDKLFTPVEARKDFLWLPGIPYYRAMAAQLGIEAHSTWKTFPAQRWREVASLPMLYDNVTRYANATVLPQATSESRFEDLDVLLPGGSIIWSAEHMRLFTPERTRRTALELAAASINEPPQIDPKGVAAITSLFDFLKAKGVEVILAHPPFNPQFYDTAMQGPYADGLRRVEALTRDFATKYGWRIIGSFDARDVGCDETMYIDAEHANPQCLAKLLAPVDEPYEPRRDTPVAMAHQPARDVAPAVVPAAASVARRAPVLASAAIESAPPTAAGPVAASIDKPGDLAAYHRALATYGGAVAHAAGEAVPRTDAAVAYYRDVIARYGRRVAQRVDAQAGATTVAPVRAPPSRLVAISRDARALRAPARPAGRSVARRRAASAKARNIVAIRRAPTTVRYPKPRTVPAGLRAGTAADAPGPVQQLVWPGDRQAVRAAASATQQTMRQ